MNIRILIYIIVGLIVFLGIWLFSMVSGIALMVGFGFGVLLHNYLDNMFKNWQKNIYLTEKSNLQQKQRELEAELEKLKKDV
jgi:hypothetical protein